MWHCKSLRLTAAPQHRFRPVRRPGMSVSARGAAAPHAGAAEGHGQCFAVWRSERCGAGCVPRLAAHRGWVWIYSCDGIHSFGHTLRLYIRPHCVKWSPVSRAAPLVSSTAGAPCGFTQQALCKVAYAGSGLSVVGAPPVCSSPTRRQLPPLRCAGALASVSLLRKCFWSVACGHVSCVCPAHPLGLATLRAALARRGLPVRPQGLPQPARGQGARFMQALRACPATHPSQYIANVVGKVVGKFGN